MSTATFNRRLKELQGPVPDVDGMGYVTDHVQGGAGFSQTRYSHKELKNGHWVHLVEFFPSPWLPKSEGITCSYRVYLGQTDDGEDGPCPFPCPVGSFAWAPDAEVDWFADFGADGEAAEKYAKKLPKFTNNP